MKSDFLKENAFGLNIKDVYKFQSKLGSGGFGTVYKCYKISEGVNSQNFKAVKAIKKALVQNNDDFRLEV